MNAVLVGIGVGLVIVLATRYLNRILNSLEPMLARQAVGVLRLADRLVRVYRAAIYDAVLLIGLVVVVAGFLTTEDETMREWMAGVGFGVVLYEVPRRLGRYRPLAFGVCILLFDLGTGLYVHLAGESDWPWTYISLAFGLAIAAPFIVVGSRTILSPSRRKSLIPP